SHYAVLEGSETIVVTAKSAAVEWSTSPPPGYYGLEQIVTADAWLADAPSAACSDVRAAAVSATPGRFVALRQVVTDAGEIDFAPARVGTYRFYYRISGPAIAP